MSLAMLNTTALPSSTSLEPHAIISVVLLVFIMIIGLVGNSIVVIIVVKKRRMQTFTNWMILNLAIADLSVALFCIPLDLPMELNGNRWIYGKVFCSFFYPLQTSSVYGSVFTLVVLSLSRFWAITRPFRKQPSMFCAKVLICVIWVCSIIVVIPYMLVLKYDEKNEACSEDWTKQQSQTYTIAIFVFQYVLPLSIICVAYLYIVYELCWRRQSATESRDSTTSKSKRQETKKVIKLLCVITITFAVCVLPFHIVALCSELGNAKDFPYYWDISLGSYLLLLANSALNPIIYNVFNSKFRESFKELYKTVITWICHPNSSHEEIGFFSDRRKSYFPDSRVSSGEIYRAKTVRSKLLVPNASESPRNLLPVGYKGSNLTISSVEKINCLIAPNNNNNNSKL